MRSHLQNDCGKVVQLCHTCNKVYNLPVPNTHARTHIHKHTHNTQVVHKEELAKHREDSKECGAAAAAANKSDSCDAGCVMRQELRHRQYTDEIAKLLGRIEALERSKIESMSSGCTSRSDENGRRAEQLDNDMCEHNCIRRHCRDCGCTSQAPTRRNTTSNGGSAGECGVEQQNPAAPPGAARMLSHGVGGAAGGVGGGTSGGGEREEDGGTLEEDDLQKFLDQYGMRNLASRLCEETGVTSVSDLALLQAEDVQVRQRKERQGRGAACDYQSNRQIREVGWDLW